MKICPQCRATYDDTNNFCLNDGITLQFFDGEPQTVIRNEQPDFANQNANNYGQNNYGQTANLPTPQKSNSTVAYLLGGLVLLLLGGIVVAGVYFLTNNGNQVAQNNTNTSNIDLSNEAVVSNVSNASNSSPSVNVNAKTANVTTNVNKPAIANVAPSPSASPLSAAQIDSAKQEISGTINTWKTASEERNINAHLNNYADAVNYYNGGIVPVSKVRADKERAFGAYDSIEFTIDNEATTLNAKGDKATVLFDKEWNFSGEGKSSNGKVRQQLTLVKKGGRWLITGERDLSVYYKNS